MATSWNSSSGPGAAPAGDAARKLLHVSARDGAEPPLLHLSEGSPFRPVSWRWDRARRLRADGLPLHRLRDDAFVAAAHDFQAAHRACENEWELVELQERYPDLFLAYQTYAATAVGGSAACTRWEVEARLLAGDEIFEHIAEQTNLSVRAVQWYERLFYNVRDRMHQTGYLINYGVGPKVHVDLLERDVDLLWKLVALAGGIIALEDFMRVVTPATVEDPAVLPGFYREQSKNVIDRRGLVAGLTFRVRDPMARGQVLELQFRYQELLQNAQGAGITGEGGLLLESVRAMLANVKFSVSTKVNERPAHVLENGAELRASHLLLAAAGEEVKLPDGFAEAAFPAARHSHAEAGGPDDLEYLAGEGPTPPSP